MTHAGKAHVLHVLILPGDLCGDIEAWHRPSKNAVASGILRRGVVVDPYMKLLPSNELSVSHFPVIVSRFHTNYAVLDFKLVYRHSQLIRGHLQQGFAGSG